MNFIPIGNYLRGRRTDGVKDDVNMSIKIESLGKAGRRCGERALISTGAEKIYMQQMATQKYWLELDGVEMLDIREETKEGMGMRMVDKSVSRKCLSESAHGLGEMR